MSAIANSPFNSDDGNPDGQTNHWDSQHHDSDQTHSGDNHEHHQWYEDLFDPGFFLKNQTFPADNWHFLTPDSGDIYTNILGDVGDRTEYWVHQNFDPTHPDGIVVGDPGHDMKSWHQQTHPDDCAIVAQQCILESLTGEHFSENSLCVEAQLESCYFPGAGTPSDHVGHLLEDRGIPIEHHYGGTFSDLNDKLSQGEKVIVAVNSHELWMPDRDSILGQTLSHYPGIPGQQADHAVVVTGIVYPKSDPLHPQIVLNDSGNSNGRGIMVPWEQFDKAWASSDRYMVATMHNGNDISIHNSSFNTSEESIANESHHFMLGFADVTVDDLGYVYRNGYEVAHFNGCTLVNTGRGNHTENSLGTIAIFDRGSGYIRDQNYNIIGRLDSFGNVYRSTSSFPLATNCHSIRKATALVLFA